LQSSEFPDLRQNTANFKLNYGLPHHLELDLTRPIFPSTAPVAQSGSGMGDANPGIKWNLRLAAQNSHLPALGASLYIEFLPETGDSNSARN